MEIPDTHIEQFDQFHKGLLTEPERAVFSQRLESDAEFAEQFQHYQSAREAIDLFAEASLKTRFQEQYHAEKMPKATVKPLLSRRVWLVAAAAVALLVAVWLGSRLGGSSFSPEELYASNYVLPPLNVRGESENQLDSLSTLIGQGQFLEALVGLESLTANDTFDRKPAAWYRLGLCQMELGDFDSAVDAFSQIPPSNPLVHEGRWYAALSFLRLNDLPQAKIFLQQILDESRNVALKEKAAALMEEFP